MTETPASSPLRLLIPPPVAMITGAWGTWYETALVLPRPGVEVLALYAHDPTTPQVTKIVHDFGHGDIGLIPIIKPTIWWTPLPALPRRHQKPKRPATQLGLFQ